MITPDALRVLLVEDNPEHAFLLQEQLRLADRTRFVVTHLERVGDAERLLWREPFDVILTDLNLPDSGGLETCRRLHDCAPDIPLLALTALDDEDIAVEALKEGAQDYLVKGDLDGPGLSRALIYAVERGILARNLRVSIDRQAAILDTLPALVALLNNSGDIVSVNREWERFRRTLTEPQLVEPPAYHYLPVAPEETSDPFAFSTTAAHVHKAVERVLLGEDDWFEHEYQLPLPGESPRWFRLMVRPVAASQGHRGAVVMHIEVTENRQQAEAIRESEERFREMVRHVPGVFWMIDRAQREALFVSPQYSDITGESAETFYRDPNSWLRLVPADDLPRVTHAWETLYQGKPFLSEFRIKRPDEVIRHVRMLGRAVLDESDNVVRLVGFLEDITRTRLLEEELFHSQKLEAVGKLAGGVAHDFNNILTAIMGLGTSLSRAQDADSRSQYLSDLHEYCQRAAGLTKQLLLFSRKQPLRRNRIDLATFVRQTSSLLRRLLGEDLILEVHTDPLAGFVEGDPDQLTQVLINLAVNARDAMPRGGTFSIRVSPHTSDTLGPDDALSPGIQQPCARLTVSDNGAGMERETIDHIFDPFFTTKPVGSGTGLGLSTVYGIVKQHGGRVGVESLPGQGTTFTIDLPLAETLQVPAPNRETLIIAGSGDTAELARATILVAEDEDVLRRLIGESLVEKGYRIFLAGSVEQAKRQFQEAGNSVDLLLADVIMPDGTGPELYAQLAEHQPQLKVLYMSGYTDDAFFRYGIKSEGIPLLEKPFTPQQLLQRIREQLVPHQSDGTSVEL